MSQESNTGAPSASKPQESRGPATEPAPDVIFPICPKCGADPLYLWRLRYDFPDGVVAEVLFCANAKCRAAIDARLVGFERPRMPKPVDPPTG